MQRKREGISVWECRVVVMVRPIWGGEDVLQVLQDRELDDDVGDTD
jgi:hypothetical protein